MSTEEIVIIDYGLGNLLSVKRAFTHCGVRATISDLPSAIESAPALVLPGVGAFADGMAGLRSRRLIPVITEYAQSGRPLLGICLGMQMLFETAEEFGHHQGLKIIPGEVREIPATGSDGRPHKIPHIGWNSLVSPTENPAFNWADTILENVVEGESVYFVHSFMAVPTTVTCRVADTYYNGQRIAAVVRQSNVWGCQFHPEKSGPVGLKIIRSFAQELLSTNPEAHVRLERPITTIN